jgi:3-phosphoshikimate 1-carboxyvinyltransferase
MPVASAQVKSCVLLAGLNASGRTRVIESGAETRDHTERMLRWLGVEVETTIETSNIGVSSKTLSIDGPSRLSAHDIQIPGDISSAAFFIAAASLLPGSGLEINGVGLNETRAAILQTMRLLGADVRVSQEREESNEAVGDITVCAETVLAGHGGGQQSKLRGPAIAQLIDELPMLAVVGTQLPGGLEIREAGELRVKESDRIGAVVENLRAMGAQVEEHVDGMTIHGAARLRGARLKTHGDHRIAMAFTVAALIADSESELDDAGCARISFPEFFELLESVVER